VKRTTRRTATLIAAAAVLAAAFAPAFVRAQESAPQAAPAQPRIERGPLAELGLTPDQVKALEAFHKARVEERRAFRDQMTKLRDEMRTLRRDPRANQAKLDALIDQRAGLVAARDKEAFRARAERDKIFTPEQLEKLKTLRSDRAGRGLGARARLAHGRSGRAFGPRAGLRSLAARRALRCRSLYRGWRW